jgi:hypothetical protein
MSSSELHPQTRAWLNWEWRAALITIIGGFVIAAAYLGYLTYQAAHAPKALTPEEAARVRTALIVRSAELVCAQAITAAKSFGIVPSYAQLADPLPHATNVTGRYTCSSRTQVATYNMAVDLVCRQLRDRRCVVLYSVSQPDGTMLYQRQR